MAYIVEASSDQPHGPALFGQYTIIVPSNLTWKHWFSGGSYIQLIKSKKIAEIGMQKFLLFQSGSL